jgi:hypothetical protein
MILTEAKKQAQSEFEQALSEASLTMSAARSRLENCPHMKKATNSIRHF